MLPQITQQCEQFRENFHCLSHLAAKVKTCSSLAFVAILFLYLTGSNRGKVVYSLLFNGIK